MGTFPWKLAFGVAALAAAGAAALAAEEEIDTVPAMREALAWVEGLDAGRYGAAWDEAAQPFRDALERGKWEAVAAQVRGPLGAVNARRLRKATYTRTLPGAPPGEYVVVEYETHFERRARSVETVTPMRGADGRWRVSGYFIR